MDSRLHILPYLCAATILWCMGVSARTLDELHISGACDVNIVTVSDGNTDIMADETKVNVSHTNTSLSITSLLNDASSRASVSINSDCHFRLIEVQGRAIVTADSLSSSDGLSIISSGAAKIDIARISAPNVNISLTGSGKIKVSQSLTASTLNLSAVGSGSINAYGITASHTYITERGSAKINIAGAAHDCSAVVHGTGTVDLRDIVASGMNLKLFGAGKLFYPAGVRVTLDGNSERIIQVKPYQPL